MSWYVYICILKKFITILLLYVYLFISPFFYIASLKPLKLLAYINDRTGTVNHHPLPVAVVKISNNTAEDKFYGIKYSHEIIFEDNGSIQSAATVAAVDRRRNVMLMGSVFTSGISRCELDL